MKGAVYLLSCCHLSLLVYSVIGHSGEGLDLGGLIHRLGCLGHFECCLLYRWRCSLRLPGPRRSFCALVLWLGGRPGSYYLDGRAGLVGPFACFICGPSIGGCFELEQYEGHETDRAAEEKYSRADRIVVYRIYHLGLLLFAFNLSFLYGSAMEEMPGKSHWIRFPDPGICGRYRRPGKLKNSIRC